MRRPGGMRRDAICIGEPGGDGERLERIGEPQAASFELAPFREWLEAAVA
mgnify:CR=1 FL=1